MVEAFLRGDALAVYCGKRKKNRSASGGTVLFYALLPV